MIKKIEIQNFQGHKYTVLNLHPGVNVVKGPSHSGKSSIVRALVWALRNRPLGFSFKSNFASDKDSTSTKIEFENSFIERYRDKNNNNYKTPQTIKDKSPLAAMKTEVPDEILQVTRMNDINIQSQHDGYFLLQDSAGEVGKKLNNIVGLGIINDVMDRVRSRISGTQVAIKESVTLKDKLTETLKQYEGIDRIVQLVKILGELIDAQKNNENKAGEIKQLVASIETNVDELTEVNEWLAIEKQAVQVEIWFDKLMDAVNKKTELENICISIKRNLQELEAVDRWLNIEKEAYKVGKLSGKIMLLEGQADALFKIIKEIRQARQDVREMIVEIEEDSKDFDDLIKKEGVCPLCGKKVN